MTTPTQYESLNFYNNVNLINADVFPVQFPLHWHKYIEMAVLPLSAKIEHPPIICINQVSYILQPGDLLLIWPGELHEVIQNEESVLIGLQFPSTLFNDLPEFGPYLHLFRTFHHICQIDMPNLSRALLQHVHTMLLIEKKLPAFHGVKTLMALYEMFMTFAAYLDTTLLNQNIAAAHSPTNALAKIDLACHYITANCEQPLTLNAVANYIGFSPCYFSRLFKQLTSYSFVEYVTWQRIKKAQALLSDSSLSITEISYQSGFKSISTFNRVFLQYRGCSPSDYRRYYLS